MMKTKEEMMKEAIKMGLNAGAVGCIAVLSAEELEVLLGNSNKPAEPQKDEKELRKEAIAQVYVDQIDDLIERLESLGYDVILNYNSFDTYEDIDINHETKIVNIVTG